MANPGGGIVADTPAIIAEGSTVVATGTSLGEAADHVGRLPALTDADAEAGAGAFRSTWGTGLSLLAEATRLLGLVAQAGAHDLENIDAALAEQALLPPLLPGS